MATTSHGSETLSAFYDSRGEAEAAASELAAIVPDSVTTVQGSDQSADGGGEGKGFFESLSDFFGGEDRGAYAEGISRGGYVLCVTDVAPEQRERVLDVLESSGAVDFDAREQSWRDEGWTGYQAGGAAGATGQAYAEDRTSGFAEQRADYDATEGDKVEVVEEQLRVGKRDVGGGRVRVRSHVREEPVSTSVDLREERVEVERRPVDRAVAAGEDPFRERSIEAEEHSEEAVVSKEARVVEEVSLHKDAHVREETVSDTVRRTEVEVEREDEPTRR